jgi:SAM-dependent methyltransferase
MTQEYYQHNAQRFFNDTVAVDMESLYRPFTTQLPPGSRVLDAGCGSGRDALAFRGMGYRVDAFDASPNLAALARAHSGLPVREMRFQDLEAQECYEGIWCCASLLHVARAELPSVMARLARALKPGGVWYLSFKYGSGERRQEGRCFTDLDESGLNALLAPLPQLTLLECWQTRDLRPERSERWLNALLRRES